MLKCKDYYVDCINVVSYDVSKLCSKQLDRTFFFSDQNSKIKNPILDCSVVSVNLSNKLKLLLPKTMYKTIKKKNKIIVISNHN